MFECSAMPSLVSESTRGPGEHALYFHRQAPCCSLDMVVDKPCAGGIWTVVGLHITILFFVRQMVTVLVFYSIPRSPALFDGVLIGQFISCAVDITPKRSEE